MRCNYYHNSTYRIEDLHDFGPSMTTSFKLKSRCLGRATRIFTNMYYLHLKFEFEITYDPATSWMCTKSFIMFFIFFKSKRLQSNHWLFQTNIHAYFLFNSLLSHVDMMNKDVAICTCNYYPNLDVQIPSTPPYWKPIFLNKASHNH